MKGTITTRHLVVNAPTIISEFGVSTYLRCWAAVVRHPVVPTTFLDVVMQEPKKRVPSTKNS